MKKFAIFLLLLGFFTFCTLLGKCGRDMNTQAFYREREEAKEKEAQEKHRPHANVRVNAIGLGIENTDPYAWEDVEVIINWVGLSGGYRAKLGTVPAGGFKLVAFGNFTDEEGERFNILRMKPKDVTIVTTYDGHSLTSSYEYD